LGPGAEPAAIEVSERDLFRNLHEDDLVTWRGRLIDREMYRMQGKAEDVLVLQEGEATVRVLLAGETNRTVPFLPLNSQLQVTGVYSSLADGWSEYPMFRILLRRPEDVCVVGRPPIWASWNKGRILLTGGLLGVLSLAWIGFLRHQVTRRTGELALANTRLLAEIEERKRAQTELSRTLATEKELSQLKSQFVSMVSHEFRTPLGVILASADLLSDYLETLTPAERAEQVADIKQSTHHMADLMEDVLVLGRVESGKMGYHPRSFDLLDFCQRLIDEMLSATNRRCPFPLTAEDISAPARGDETLLRHIFHNLLANGAKYSPAGQAVQFQVARAGEEAVFTVSDQGIGIPAEEQKYVFEAFYRGKNVGDRPGSGLGLVVVKRCVELHGGTVELQSTEGMGAKIIVRLPLFRAASETQLLQRTLNAPTAQIA
jgi:signal transduction histidine kinase